MASGKETNIESQKGYRDEFDAMRGKEAGIMQDKSFDGNGGSPITVDAINAQYTVETVVMAVLAAAIFALLVGFITGYFCGRRCHKDEDDNLPYPDTEYEYFEQRSNINR
jgi:semaphorin 6